MPHERHATTLTHTLGQSEKPTQNPILAAQWIETIQNKDRPIPIAEKNR